MREKLQKLHTSFSFRCYNLVSEIYERVIEIIKRNNGLIKDNELYEELKKEYDIGFEDFNRILMVLELRRFIYVETIKRNHRLIQLLKNAGGGI